MQNSLKSLKSKQTDKEKEFEFYCPIREMEVVVKKFYHFFSRGCCSVYSHLYGAFCEREEECKELGVFDRCPLIKEIIEIEED